jgi:hypothetical protein
MGDYYSINNNKYNSLSNINFNKLNNYINIINNNINNLYSNFGYCRFNLKCKGLCWSEEMEVEAEFLINPEVDIQLRFPLLHTRAVNNYINFCNIFCEKLGVNNLRQFIQYRNKYPHMYKRRYKVYDAYKYIIDKMHLDCTPQLFEGYLEKRIKKRLDSGFSMYSKQEPLKYILRQMAAHQALMDTKIGEIPCTCHNETKPKDAMMKVLPVAENDTDCIIYNSCLRTLYAAFKRQLKATPRPEQDVMDDFIRFSKNLIDKYITPHIHEFDYSYTRWYEHLTAGKQKKMDKARKAYIEMGCPTIVEFGLFCKREVQQKGGKNRAIANISDIVKYIVGPVCWSLEAMFTKLFPGYCGNKSGEQLENWLADTYAKGFITSLQGDGSGFDLSQHQCCKKIDNYIYNLISTKVHHVKPADFLYIANMSVRYLNASIFINKKQYKPFGARIEGTVFSGSSDTTLMNTIRMACYNHYTLYKAGLTMDDYRLLAKGDDFMFFVNTGADIKKIQKAYATLWSSKPKDPMSLEQNLGKKGLGQIIKFLKIGDYTELDFCSNAVIPFLDGKTTRFKVLRRPERMIELSHYARKILHYTPGQAKTYYQQLAMIIEKTSGLIPFYENYHKAYNYWASTIPAQNVSIKEGDKKKACPIDDTKWHSNSFTHDKQYTEFYKKFNCYGEDFVHSVYGRLSSTKIPREYVYRFLLEKYGLTKTMIDRHSEVLLNFNCIYNPVSDMILRD